MLDRGRSLSFKPISKDLEALTNNLKVEIEDNQPPHSFELIVSGMLRDSLHHLLAIVDLLRDDRLRFESDKSKFCLEAHVIARCMLDNLFNFLAMSLDPQNMVGKYFKSGWREAYENYVALTSIYADAPEMSKWLSDYKDKIDRLAIECMITPQELKDLKSIKFWPSPSKIAAKLEQNSTLGSFVKFLNKVHYSNYAQISHLTLRGLALRHELDRRIDNSDTIEALRYRVIFQAIIWLLCLDSESNEFFHCKKNKRLRVLWEIICAYADDAKEVFSIRYQNLV